MPELTADIPFNVYCDCGAALCGQTHVDRNNNVTIAPCERCLEEARKEGYDEGVKDGKAEGAA
jgi:hypothetical protein